MSELARIVTSIPPITRTFTLTSLVMDGLNSFGIVPYSSFACFFPEAVKKFELYRFVTGFLIPNPQPMQGLMEMYVMYTFSKGVETKKFGRNFPDYFFYLAITFPLMLFGAYFFLPPVLSLSPALQSALTYTWAIDNYDQKVNFYFIPLQASLLPVVSLGFRILVDGQLSFLLALIGMSAAYIYNCIETHSFGPLESFFLARHGNATNRLGAGNNILRWVYSTGKLQAPQWLRTIFSKLTGNDYNSAPLNGGIHVTPSFKQNPSGGRFNREKRAFQGKGRRLGTKED